MGEGEIEVFKGCEACVQHYLCFFAQIILAKYISAWLLAEGACVIAGLGFNGKDEATGKTRWNGSANVHVIK